MTIILNNNTETLPYNSLTVNELITEKNITYDVFIVNVNNKLIIQSEYNSTEIKDGDNVWIIQIPPLPS